MQMRTQETSVQNFRLFHLTNLGKGVTNIMKMKRILALLLAGCMVFGEAGCGKDADKKGNNNSNVSAEVPDYMNMESQLPIVKE